VLQVNNTINVLEYGARNDGKTDCSDIINAAVLELYEQGGGTIFFPKGKYAISKPIIKKARVSIKGAGALLAFLVWNSTQHGGTIIDTTNESLHMTSIEDIGFIRAPGASLDVRAIRGGSTLAKYNSAMGIFKNLAIFNMWYGIDGTTEPEGVGIFDCKFENVWMDHVFQGFKMRGSGNIIINPRVIYCDQAFHMGYLNGESFDGWQVYGGVGVQNNYDIAIVGKIRPSSFIGAWFEQSKYGLINIPYPDTDIMRLTIQDCVLNTNAVSFPLCNLHNAKGRVNLERLNIVKVGLSSVQIIKPKTENVLIERDTVITQ
jgi:hypothetical protein